MEKCKNYIKNAVRSCRQSDVHKSKDCSTACWFNSLKLTNQSGTTLQLQRARLRDNLMLLRWVINTASTTDNSRSFHIQFLFCDSDTVVPRRRHQSSLEQCCQVQPLQHPVLSVLLHCVEMLAVGLRTDSQTLSHKHWSQASLPSDLWTENTRTTTKTQLHCFRSGIICRHYKL